MREGVEGDCMHVVLLGKARATKAGVFQSREVSGEGVLQVFDEGGGGVHESHPTFCANSGGKRETITIIRYNRHQR